MKGEDMGLLDRIANYFKEWDGIDDTTPKIELNIHELRYIADMNVERCRLIRQLKEADLKTGEIRAKAIDEVFNFLKTQRDRKSMKVNFDDLEIKEYKEQLKGNEFFNFDSPVVRIDEKSYNKAIDDVLEKALEWNKNSSKKVPYAFIHFIAEELKGVGWSDY